MTPSHPRTTLHAVPLLNGVLTIHDPTTCDCGPNPRRCIPDVEAFCRSILNEQTHTGAKTASGFSGGFTFTPHDYDECLTDLVSIAWEEQRRYDGRGRLAGYLLWILNKRVTDWKRSHYGSTRYNRPVIELTDDERHLAAAVVDFTGPEVIDLIRSVDEPHKTTLERIVIPIVFGEKTLEDIAAPFRRGGTGLSTSDIRARIRRLGTYLEENQLLAA